MTKNCTSVFVTFAGLRFFFLSFHRMSKLITRFYDEKSYDYHLLKKKSIYLYYFFFFLSTPLLSALCCVCVLIRTWERYYLDTYGTRNMKRKNEIFCCFHYSHHVNMNFSLSKTNCKKKKMVKKRKIKRL